MNPQIAQILSDPAASDWLKRSLTSALARDCVDSANDVKILASVLAEQVGRKPEPPILFDYEVEAKLKDGSRTLVRVHSSPTFEDAESQIKSLKDVVSSRVVRILRQYNPENTPISELTPCWVRTQNGSPASPKYFVIRDSLGQDVLWSYGGSHLRTAWHFLMRDIIKARWKTKAKWKTLTLLAELELAIRADTKAGHTAKIAELLQGKPLRRRTESYIAAARRRFAVYSDAKSRKKREV